MEYCTNIRGLFCAYFRGLIQSLFSWLDSSAAVCVDHRLFPVYGLYFAFYSVLAVR
jgi:hypothetical protein